MSTNRIPGRRTFLADPGECTTCDRIRAEGHVIYPPHDAGSGCRSGSRNHCTCDTCF